MHRRALLLAPLALVFPAAAQAPVPVVASFSVVADMLRAIGGPAIRVTSIVGPEQDAHGFRARPSDLRAVQAAKLVVAHGLGFDPWMDRLVRAANFSGPQARAATGTQPRIANDPHAWQDLGNAPVYARNIAAALKRALAAEQHAGIDSRAADFLREAAETDAWVRAQFAPVPPDRRRVITSHDAFGHFAAAYGVEFRSPQGVSTESEPSAAEVARLIRLIRESGVRAVFLENMSNPRLIEQVARDAGVRLGGTLYADALSAPGGPADTYLKMFRHNVPTMIAAMTQ